MDGIVMTGLAVCLVAAAVVLVAVAVPRVRQGAPLLSAQGEETVRETARRARALANRRAAEGDVDLAPVAAAEPADPPAASAAPAPSAGDDVIDLRDCEPTGPVGRHRRAELALGRATPGPRYANPRT